MEEPFSEYYSRYLAAHKHPATKILHFCGTALTILYIWWIIWLGLNVHYFAFGYLWFWPNIVRIFAWPSHYWIERNDPLGKYNKWLAKWADWKMTFEVFSCKIPLDGRNLNASIKN